MCTFQGKDEKLYWAAASNDVAAIRRLLKNSLLSQGADVNCKFGVGEQTALHRAASLGHVQAAQALLEAGADVGATTENGWTPLHCAAANGKLEAVQALLEAGADLEAKNKDGWTPLHWATQYGHKAAVQALLDAGADMGATDEAKNTPLHFAALTGHMSAARALLEAGANVGAQTEDGDTPLHRAAWNNRVEAVYALLEVGADLEAKNVYGDTPLHDAARESHLEAVLALLEAGADIGAKNKAYEEPLHKAAKEGHVAVVWALLEAGADLGAKAEAGSTPLHSATRSGKVEVVRALLAAGADMAETDEMGQTSLHSASSSGNVEMVRALLEAGAYATIKDKAGRTAADMAAGNSTADIVNLLEAASKQRAHSFSTAMPQFAIFQGGTISMPHVLTHEQVSPLNSRLVKAGLQAVGHVVQGTLTCNPVALIAGCVMLVSAVTAEVRAVQYCQHRIGRVLARCGAMVPALQKLEQVLSRSQSTSLHNSLVGSMSKTLLVLAQVLLGLDELLAQMQGGSGSKLARALRVLKGQCYQQQLDDLEQELRDCLTQLTAVIGISKLTQQAAEALQRKDLQVALWAEQNTVDRRCDLEQLEGQVLAVAGGVEALQEQLMEQRVELDGQQVALQDVQLWLQQMNAGSMVIAGHLQELHRKVDDIQDDVSTIKDQLELLMLQARKPQQWSPTDRLPQLAITASRINAAAVREAMDDAASGSFGKVVRAKLDFVSDVAVKVFNLKQGGVKDCKEAVREAVLLSMANHPQVVRCYGLVFDPDSSKQSSIHGSLVMEWVGGGTLHEWLQDEEQEMLELVERVHVALQVAAGLQHLHGKKLVHGDLKPQNVLLTEQVHNQRVPQAKICDFGLAKYTSSSMRPTYAPKQAYTPVYTSPERLMDYALRTFEDDVYAFGMLMCYIATSSDPFARVPVRQVREAVLNGQRPAIDKWAGSVVYQSEAAVQVVQQYCQLAKECWSHDPHRRPHSNDIHGRLIGMSVLLQSN